MRYIMIVCFLISCLIGVKVNADDTKLLGVVPCSLDEIIPISMYSLIAVPAGYDGQCVKMTGYFDAGHFEDTKLYVDKDSLDNLIVPNSVHLNLGKDGVRYEHYRGHLATLVGRVSVHFSERGESLVLLNNVKFPDWWRPREIEDE